MEQVILKEETYERQMKHIVEPYLEEHGEVLYPEREAGQKLFCMHYRTGNVHPSGVVVISHGFTESVEKYKENIYYFLRAGYHVYMADHCGHGKSYRLNTDPSLVHVDRFERYALDLNCVADLAARENPGLPLYLYGHSMGGGVAAVAAAMRPELYKKVVLTSPMIRPLTNGIPWTLSKGIAATACLLGKGGSYVMGTKPYQTERFEDSVSLSKARFYYYQAKREAQQVYQTAAPSYSWLHEAVRMNRYLQKTAVKQISAPVLLFQAENDTLVSGKEQERFIASLKKRNAAPARLVRVPVARHEIFNSEEEILEPYWKKVFAFLKEA